MKLSTLITEQHAPKADDKILRRTEKAVTEAVEDDIREAIMREVGPDLAHYFSIRGVKLVFDWTSYEEDQRKKDV